eukprot:COSAG01_NODE_1307_length_10805_cov_22.707547_5_plen_175_part_00
MAWFAGEWGGGHGRYWKRAAAAYKAMLSRGGGGGGGVPCDTHEWHAETLMSRSRQVEAVAALEDAIACNPGHAVLQERVLRNAMHGGGGGGPSPRGRAVLADATERFRAALAAQPDSAVASANLDKVLAVWPDQPSSASLSPPPGGLRPDEAAAPAHALGVNQEAMLDALLDEL